MVNGGNREQGNLGWRSRARLAKAVSADVADVRLIEAYRSVFDRGGEDIELVLVDLASFCGFYQVEQGGVSADDLNHWAGRRAAFGRIFNFLALSDAQLMAMERAARDESASRGE
jgi:hypothetical protein